MARLQAIENALADINDYDFQELCDQFLAFKIKNYTAFRRKGSQENKRKTIRGTPDSFFQLPNGNYIFMEATTNVSDKNKLEDDIEACFNPDKVDIPHNKIEQIVLCFNFNIDENRLNDLRKLAHDYNRNTRVDCWMLDNLAIELHRHHRDLVNEYLGLPTDTGQIVSIKRFIEEYNRASQGISPPLDNEFVHRQDEMNEIKQGINNSDFVIIHGKSGVGKTKLAIESIKDFIIEHPHFNAYCVSNKGHNLLDDLYQYMDKDEDYILFVDDANRIDVFKQILGFYNSLRENELKIIITVRDYARDYIELLCQSYDPEYVEVEKFDDEQIKDMIEAEPFKILNPDYQREILRISDGNPKLAIMTSLLAKEEQNLYALSNVSELFESYFATFILDNEDLKKPINLRCLGLISFFNTFPYKNKQLAKSVLSDFNIDYYKFIEIIDKLEDVELLNRQFGHVKIPEQNLANFLFYKAFIDRELLAFGKLLVKYFDNNTDRFKDCVVSANNTFGPRKVKDKIQPDLRKYLNSIKSDENKAFEFLTTFWFYLQSETLDFLLNKINHLPNSDKDFVIENDNKSWGSNSDQYIDLLSSFYIFLDNLNDALYLSLQYIRKKPDVLYILIDKIERKLTFDSRDYYSGFKRQQILFNIIIDGLEKGDKLCRILFYELSKTFLKFRYNQTKSGKGRQIYWYDIKTPNVKPIREFRKNIWLTIIDQFEDNQNNSLTVLNDYAPNSPFKIKEIMEFDLQYILRIIDEYLAPSIFGHCLYVHKQIDTFRRNEINRDEFTEYLNLFTNST